MDIQLQDIHNKLASLHLQQQKKIVLISLMTTYGGEGCLFDDICKEAGVINGLSAAGLKNGQPLTKEMLVKINPDVLFYISNRFRSFHYYYRYTEVTHILN